MRKLLSDRFTVLNVILVLAAISMVTIIVFAAISVPSSLTTQNNTEAVKEGTDISNCRALYAAKSQAAQNAVTNHKAELDIKTNQLVRALAEDRSQVPQILAESRLLEEAVSTALLAGEMRSAAFEDAALRAQKDPEAFLRQCKESPP